VFLELPGKVAVVTGGARGIGFAIAERLSQAGASVVIADVAEDGAIAAAERVREGGGKAAAAVADITSPDEVDAMIGRALDAFGTLDILVNNAGITGSDAPLWETTDEDWHKVLDLNLTGIFYCCRAAVSHMRERQSGAIVNVASISGKEGNPNMIPLLGLEGRGDLPDQGAGQGGDPGQREGELRGTGRHRDAAAGSTAAGGDRVHEEQGPDGTDGPP